MAERILYQFPISHYCEKTRWNLDAKGLSYRIVNLLPGLHKLRTRQYHTGGTVPILVDRGRGVADSTEIALHLEREYPQHPLLPSDDVGKRRALELEAYFDHAFGIHCRRWMYHQLIASPHLIGAVFNQEYSLPARVFGKVVAPLFRRGLKQRYTLTEEAAATSRLEMMAGIDRLEREIDGDPGAA